MLGKTFLHPHRIRELIRSEFRAPIPEKQVQQSLGRAFEALRLFHEPGQRFHEDCVSSAVTNNLLVEVNCSSLGRAPGGPSPRYVFTYRVRFENLGDRPVGLLGRHLVFQDVTNNELPPLVVPRNSPGVVGLSPVLAPGTSFIYASGTDFASGLGLLNGSYQMAFVNDKDVAGEGFDAVIAPLVFKNDRSNRKLLTTPKSQTPHS